MKIFLDDLFLINLLIDFIILRISVAVLKLKEKSKRKLFGIAGIQAFVFCILLVVSRGRIINVGIISALTVFLELVIAGYMLSDSKKGKYRIKEVLHICEVIFVVTLLCGGLFTYLYSNTFIGVILLWVYSDMTHYALYIYLFMISIWVVWIIKKGVERLNSMVMLNKTKCYVILKMGHQCVKVNAIMDSGNSLYEPISKRPVSIVEQAVIKPFLQNKVGRIYLIPYSSVGNTDACMYGIEIDEMRIITDSKETVRQNAIIGICKDSISGGKYSMLLNREYIEMSDGIGS